MGQTVRVRGTVRTGMLALLTAGVLCVGACGSGPKVKPVVVPTVVAAPGQPRVTVTNEQAGAGVELGREQELVVRLANGVVFAREWSLVDLAPGVLGAAGPTFERDLRSITSGEASGTSIWRFRPLAAGTVTLRFEYRRPRNVEPATEVVTYAVTVR